MSYHFKEGPDAKLARLSSGDCDARLMDMISLVPLQVLEDFRSVCWKGLLGEGRPLSSSAFFMGTFAFAQPVRLQRLYWSM